MYKPRIYLESSVVSYLANRPSGDARTALRQLITHQWWESVERSSIWVSQLVLDEVSQGNPEAAQRRLELIRDLPLIEVSLAATELAIRLVQAGVVPITEPEDATHIATAVIEKFQFLVTWNFSHFVGIEAKIQLMRTIESWGYECPI